MVLAVTVAELVRRHHRAVAGHAWRHGKRGARWPRGPAATGQGGARWQGREHRPLMFTRGAAAQQPAAPFTPVLLTARSKAAVSSTRSRVSRTRRCSSRTRTT